MFNLFKPSTMYKFILTSFTLCFLFSCYTSKSALEDKKYVKAMNLAANKIKSGKNIEENTYYLQMAGEELANQTIHNYQSQESTNVKDWKRSRTKFYRVLTQMHKNNLKTGGLLSKSYDGLCKAKHELDLRIVDYYFEEGLYLLDQSIERNESKWARDAYYQFQISEKEGASQFYNNLEELKEEAIYYGSILVDIPEEVELDNMFLIRASPENASKADCKITIDESMIDFNQSIDESKESKSKVIKVGEKAVVDTAGVTTYEDVLEEVTGYKNIKEITYTATQDIILEVTANNSECFLEDNRITLEVSEECTEIKYTGEKSVFTSAIDCTCWSSFSKEWDLERELKRKRENELIFN